MHRKGLKYHFIQSEGNKTGYFVIGSKGIYKQEFLIKSFITNFLFNRLPQACFHLLTAELQSLGFSPPYKDCRFNSGSV